MKYLNHNSIARVISILICFLIGLILIFTGWQRTGELWGLIQMVIGVGVLLIALAVYNYPFRDRR